MKAKVTDGNARAVLSATDRKVIDRALELAIDLQRCERESVALRDAGQQIETDLIAILDVMAEREAEEKKKPA